MAAGINMNVAHGNICVLLYVCTRVLSLTYNLGTHAHTNSGLVKN